MKKILFSLFLLTQLSTDLFAQYDGYRHEGEFGVQLGAAHYFGDLNPNKKLNRPKIAGGVFFRKQVNSYVAVRIGANFAQLGYSDIYEKKNEFRMRRNLSFNTNLWAILISSVLTQPTPMSVLHLTLLLAPVFSISILTLISITRNIFFVRLVQRVRVLRHIRTVNFTQPRHLHFL